MENLKRKREFRPSSDSEMYEEPRKIARVMRKKIDLSAAGDAANFPGMILVDTEGRQWKIGGLIGMGGFGKVFSASDDTKHPVDVNHSKYVVKIEPFKNASLLSEIRILLRIEELKRSASSSEPNIRFRSSTLPKLVAYGSHAFHNRKYRFVVLERFRQTLTSLVHKRKVGDKSLILLAIHLLNAIENLHYFKFCHNDIKGGNIMIATNKCPVKEDVSNCESNENKTMGMMVKRLIDQSNQKQPSRSMERDQLNDERESLKLIDLGIATKYQDGNVHRRFSLKRHLSNVGTTYFSSRDSHLGAFSRRGDLESLGYNLIFWSQGFLPWSRAAEFKNYKKVHFSKEIFMQDAPNMIKLIYGRNVPKCVGEFLHHVNCLDFAEVPNYNLYRCLFRKEYLKWGSDRDLTEVNTIHIQQNSIPKLYEADSFKWDLMWIRRWFLLKKIKSSSTLRKFFLPHPIEIISKRVAHEYKMNNAVKFIGINRCRSAPVTCAKLVAQQRLQPKRKPKLHDDNRNSGRGARYNKQRYEPNCDGSKNLKTVDENVSPHKQDSKVDEKRQ